ncbi:inverse autotransporter beta domain-containing protein [Legionella lansingensis]|nr:inverse autotransporter beta-barrel domain-containing protein [Legionella lansingensis]
MQSKKKLSWLVLLLFSTSASAVADNPISILPLPPRLNIWGSTGNNTFGEGDAMIPLSGNPNQILYGDISGKYGDDRAWYVSGGLGGRKIVRNTTILGAYFFTDYNKTPNANYFTVLNPGIELMSNRWDGHLNGYVPIGKRKDLMGIFTTNQLGKPNMSFFSGHAQYEPLFD